MIRSAYGPRKRVALTEFGPGRTKQSFKKECDINTIMARYRKTGVLDFLSQRKPEYLDVTGADFREAMDLVAGAKANFGLLPAEIRSRFRNDPALFLEAWDDPARDAEFIAAGLKPKPEPVAPPPVPEAPAPAPQ